MCNNKCSLFGAIKRIAGAIAAIFDTIVDGLLYFFNALYDLITFLLGIIESPRPGRFCFLLLAVALLNV